MPYLEQFCVVLKNSCTKMYTENLFATRNHSIGLLKNKFSKRVMCE